MDQASAAERSKVQKVVSGWAIVLVSPLLLYVVLGWFDNATELIPGHDNVLQACFAIAVLSGLASGVMGIRESKGPSVWRRAGLALGFSLLGFLSAFLAGSRIANIVEGVIDFPPGKTRSYETLLLISRAYQTHGKGRSWNIQTTPIWSNRDITEDDYAFMATHRRAGDNNTRDPDEISSNGYFCARVTMQQAGNALRVLHAGSRKLTKGSVVICPSDVGH
jgi:hypothetical protein